MKTAFNNRRAARAETQAFSLLEVMVAIGIFFMAVFAILGLVSSSLENARRLQRPIVDAGVLAGELSLTNKLVEGMDSGDLSEFLGKAYQGYTWTYAVQEVQSNKLFQVDFIVQDDPHGRPVVSKMSILLFRPQSPAGSLDGGHGPMNLPSNDIRAAAAFHAGRSHDRLRDFRHPGGGDLLDLDAHLARPSRSATRRRRRSSASASPCAPWKIP